MEVGCYIADPRHRPDDIAKQEPPTVGSLYTLCQLHNADVRDQRSPKNPIVFLEQHGGKHIKACAGKSRSAPSCRELLCDVRRRPLI